jgi:DNA-binding IclR family transcriptional regulator
MATVKKMEDKRKYSAPALEKGLDILELLANEPKGLSLTEIAVKLDRSVGQIFRMLFVLEERGYLDIDPDSENYRLSFRLFQLAHRHAPVKLLTTAAAPVMQELARKLFQSCHLVVHYRGRCIVMVQKSSPGQTGFNVRLGAEIGLTMSCSGHVLLAFSGPESRKYMLSERPHGTKSKISMKELNQILDRVRERGHEITKSAITYGVMDIGFPIFDHGSEAVASLTVPFLERIDGSNPVDLKEAVERIRESAITISKGLGCTEEQYKQRT